ncbi:MAG TPA: hypothetical protein VGB85_28420 [Nannocystis sp.]
MSLPSPGSASRPLSLILALAGLLTATGCSAARMELDPQLASAAPEQPVRGLSLAQFRKPVTFGPYSATLTKGGFKSTSQTNAGPFAAKKTSQDFAFTMSGGTSATWAGACSYGSSQRAVLFPINNDAGLVCTLVPEGSAGWQIALASEGKLFGPNSLSGTLTDGQTTYGVKMIHRLANSAFSSAEPVGYELRDAQGVAVAAVQIFNPGQVWIDPRLPAAQQTALAAGAVALLVSRSAASDINE